MFIESSPNRSIAPLESKSITLSSRFKQFIQGSIEVRLVQEQQCSCQISATNPVLQLVSVHYLPRFKIDVVSLSTTSSVLHSVTAVLTLAIAILCCGSTLTLKIVYSQSLSGKLLQLILCFGTKLKLCDRLRKVLSFQVIKLRNCFGSTLELSDFLQNVQSYSYLVVFINIETVRVTGDNFSN